MNLTLKSLKLTELSKSNSLALDALSNLEVICTSSLSDDKRKSALSRMRSAFFDSVHYVQSMISICDEMDADIDTGLCECRLNEIQERSIELILESIMSLELQYDDEDLVKATNSRLYKRVKRLTPAMRDPASESFKLKNVQTLHDLVRYLHQIGVQAAYTRSSLNEADQSAFRKWKLPNQGELRIIDAEKILPDGSDPKKIEHPLIKPIVQLYSPDLKKNGAETFKGILTKQKFMTQIHLGAHYAELEARLGEINKLFFYFKDTPKSEYKNSVHRTAYVVNVLKKLGFKVETIKNETNAHYAGKSIEEIGEKIKEVIRLTMSTKNLDLNNSYINFYPNRAVNDFMKGKTNLEKILQEYHERGIKDDSRIL